jgi:hypothetical protein
MEPRQDFVTTRDGDARTTPVRLLVVEGEERPPVQATDEPVVMTFPHLLVRELIAFLALSLGLVLAAHFFAAPLEDIASPERTPNPAKAPWYFLGLQELLHYYPPVVSGVLLPGLLVVALLVIPYVHINLERPPLLTTQRGLKLAVIAAATALCTVVFATTGAHAVWPVIGPLWAVATLVTVSAFLPGRGRVSAWLRTRSVPFWIFSWFLLCAITLTVVGVFFRGPGWRFTLPWRDGIYY